MILRRLYNFRVPKKRPLPTIINVTVQQPQTSFWDKAIVRYFAPVAVAATILLLNSWLG